MSYVITQSCCNDAICVAVCPVDCIHPTPDEPGYATTDQLYIDPTLCVDCNACAEVCPVSAIRREQELPDALRPYAGINAGYFAAARA
nr:ferredoxin family protein [Patulibacter minatonensis]